MEYYYVLFNYPDSGAFMKGGKDGYYTICLEDLKNEEGVTIVSYPLDYMPLCIRLLHRIIQFLNHRMNGNSVTSFLLKLFYPYYFRMSRQTKQKKCFVFISYLLDMNYMRYLKRTYPNCKLVMAFRDLVSTKIFYEELKNENLIDLWMSYDEGDCKRYGMKYFSEFESKISVAKPSSIPKSDVFFSGRAKKRLSQLVEAYDYFTSLGLNCLFIILEPPVDEIVEREGIIYINKMISYRKMLEYSVSSKCLLDINQEGATGYTSRFLEAIIYNKLLITNTAGILNHPLYDSRYIKVYKNIREVDMSFFDNSENVKYNYNSEFSPRHFINNIEDYIHQL